ncbi:hypothetical protein K5X82_12105 [Halosquirtibacter xylanolyticus]|uniref:hypothetical protein n=1 Tax=Halosquirtibacter xylanolyticus TaxID=3374599 RepID=UPI0037497600|nr:hypothetical protein K5X82_12105 [Prolixibacteraceae bacterium]
MEASTIPIIFFLEEDKSTREKLKKMFKKLGDQNIKWFEKEVDCLSELDSKPDIIIQDKTEDRTGGYTLLYETKKMCPHTKYYFCCSEKDKLYAEKGVKIGADEAYIINDANFEVIATKIHQEIIKKRLEKFYHSANVGMWEFFGIILLFMIIVLSVIFLNPTLF